MKLSKIDPLFQFLGAGALLLALATLVRPFGSDENTIRVDRATLEQYLVSGGGEEFAALAKSENGAVALDALTSSQRDELVRKYVEEQALYLEARAWGLDQDDLVIRRRLGQSLRFALRPEPPANPGDEVLLEFYAAHLDNYRLPAETSFDHIFYSTELRGQAAAEAAARLATQTPIRDWRATGDRFAYQRSYVGAGPAVIESQLGPDFAGTLAALPVDPDRWQGPVPSPTGFHVVRIWQRSQAETVGFEDARAAVLDDWQRNEQDIALDQAIATIVSKYDASIDDAVLAPGVNRP